ncbi:hypothetical protein CLOM_g16999 [Closterium sp. NIES-68]|nr:hypothetical protein CLOM_g16999 [Closterium sp. NIES-68]GJP67717.1 hypothetical protein CLOP_g24504 [Closterium sp. NIES-67]
MEQQSFLHASLSAYAVLILTLSLKEQLGIRSLHTSLTPAESVWKHLKGLYMAQDTISVSKILSQLTTVQVMGNENVSDYINRARTLRDQLEKCGGYFPKDMFVTVLLAGLGR